MDDGPLCTWCKRVAITIANWTPSCEHMVVPAYACLPCRDALIRAGKEHNPDGYWPCPHGIHTLFFEGWSRVDSGPAPLKEEN